MHWKSTDISKTDLERLRAGKLTQENKKKKKKSSPKGKGVYKKSKSPKAKTQAAKNVCTSGDPVNVVTGSFYIDATDLLIEDRGINLEIKRKYNSTDESTGPMGKGWTFEFESRIELRGDELTYVYPDGSVKEFEKKDEGWINASDDDELDKLTELENGQFSLKNKDKKTYIYDKDGKLISISDKNNNTLKISYNHKGEIDSIITPGGKIITFTCSSGKILQITDNIGRTVKYKYFGDNLSEVTLPNGGTVKYTYEQGWITTVTDQNDITYVKNEYDEKGRVIKQFDKNGNITEIMYNDDDKENVFIFHATNVVERYRYNDKNLLSERVYPDGTTEMYTYDIYGNKDSVTDPLGRTTEYVYDKDGYLLEEIYPNDYTVTNYYDSFGNLIKTKTTGGSEKLYAYDGKGNIIEERVLIEDDIYAVTSYSYDEHGRLIERVDPEGNVTEFEYEDHHIDKPTVIRDAEGNVFKYKYDKAGRMLSITTSYGTVEYTYNEINKVTKKVDALDNVTQMEYDMMGNLVKKILPGNKDDGAQYEFYYDDMDRLVKTIDPLKNVMALKYDIHGNLIKEINPNFYNRDADDGIGVEYIYDQSQRKIKNIYPTGGVGRTKYDSVGNVIKTIEPGRYDAYTDDGAGNEYVYDDLNRLTLIKDPEGNTIKAFEYDSDGRVAKEFNGKGHAAIYKYNLAGWLIEKRVPVDEKDSKVQYNITVYSYDKAGRRVEEKVSREYVDEKECPEEWNVISYVYDKNNRIVEVSDSTGARIGYSYDCLGNRTSEIIKINDNKNKIIRYRYNSVGLLEKKIEEIDGDDIIEKSEGKAIAQTLYDYDGNYNLTGVTTPLGYKTQVSYDKAGRITEVTKFVGKNEKRTTYYEYDSAGNLVKETDCNGNSIKYEYDSMNNRIRIIDREGGVTRLFYDEAGNVIKKVSPGNYDPKTDDGIGTSFVYDSLNRLTEVVDALGNVVQKMKFNGAGELVEKMDATMQAAEYKYDIGGRIKEISTPGAKLKGVASQQYTYDAMGNITGIKDGEGNLTQHKLDLWGRVTEIEKADGSIEKYSYDHAGNIVCSVDGNGNATEYVFNSLNKLSQIVDPIGDSITFKYDLQGRVVRKVDRNRKISEFIYNQDDSIVLKRDMASGYREEYAYNLDGTLKSAVNDAVNYNYEYTPDLKLKSKRANGKSIINYRYDRDGNLIELKDILGKVTTYKYDELGRLSEVWDASQKEASYTYNLDNTIASICYGNGTTVEYGYDEDKNITSIVSRNKDGEEIISHKYSYDNNGNQIERIEDGRATSFFYDKLNRLEKVVYPDMEETFKYDFAGNRVLRTKGNIKEEYSYDKRNRLVEKVEGGAHTLYKYDSHGNLIQESGRSGVTKYTYDCFNRTTSVQSAAGGFIKNVYDPEGLRYEVQENGNVSRFVFSGRDIVSELDGGWSLKHSTIRGHELLSHKEVTGKSYYYVNNAHGDVVNLTDSKGTVVNSYKYDAFGNTVEAKEQISNRFRLAGEQFDPVTGQYYLRARFYNPVVGRFTQEDTYRGDGLNLYSYVQNNPVNYYDPSGFSSVCSGKSNTWNEFQKANKGKYASSKEAAEAYKKSNKPKGVTYEGTIYRNVNSAFDPLDMNAYTINSNHRYTQPGTPGLYFGDSEKTVYAELGSYKVTDYSNRTMHSYDAKLDNMLDLTDPKVRKQLGVKKADLLTTDYRKNVGSATTHQMGEYALKNGYNGLVVPSARNPGGNNIVIFDPGLIK